jgi:2,4-dienoyl-CoA reductase-like NADH-dependent reductase (Old Yellow Enzyme family)/NADPH-dependent glutamate synthase beta subunit-like oxidoreductase
MEKSPEKYHHLFSPLSMGPLELKNRIVMAPMATGLFDKGCVTSQAKSFYLARARGGVGLIMVGGVYVGWPASADLSSIGCHAHLQDDSVLEGWKELIKEIHRYGTKIGVQIFHPGRQVSSGQWGDQPIGPSAVSGPGVKGVPRELTTTEIENIEDLYVDAAKRAELAGFDLVEIHGAHGYLVSSFLSSYVNKRRDDFGGSLENRARFALEIFRKIKKTLSTRLAIGIRFNGQDYVEGGLLLEESRLLAPMFEKAGMDFLDISSGVYGSYPALIPLAEPQGCFIPLAAEIKKAVHLPIIGVGMIKDPSYADRIIEEEKVDLVALGRTLIADPAWPEKAALGDLQNIRPCVHCNQGCADRIEQINFSGQSLPITCLMNPEVGKEQENPLKVSPTPKRVLVIGGGPAGLTSSTLAAFRGHQVTLIEREKTLGGQFRLAGLPPTKEDFSEALDYMSRQAIEAGVTIHREKPYTSALLKELKPEIVIVATGSRPLFPSIKGIDHENVVTAQDVLNDQVQLGENVLIIGGGLVGLEVADYLSSKGKKVQVVEITPRLGKGMGSIAWMNIQRRLGKNGVKLLTSCEVKEIRGSKLNLICKGRELEVEGIDTIVLAVGVASQNSLFEEIKKQIREVYLIGDAARPDNALSAIHEGAEVGGSI